MLLQRLMQSAFMILMRWGHYFSYCKNDAQGSAHTKKKLEAKLVSLQVAEVILVNRLKSRICSLVTEIQKYSTVKAFYE